MFPPPLPIKSRDLMPQDSPPMNLAQPENRPCDSPPPLTRTNTARVSFREPISSSYSVDEEDNEDESEKELQEGDENQQDEDEVEGGFGSRLHLQKGIPPQMDLLGKWNLQRVEYCLTWNMGTELIFSQFLFPTRWIFQSPAQSAPRVESWPHPFWSYSPPSSRKALPTVSSRPASAGHPGQEGREREGQSGLRQHLLTHPPARSLQTWRLLFYLLLIFWLRGRGLLPRTTHSSSPTAPKATTWWGQRHRGGEGEGGAERLGTEGQHEAKKS